VTKGRRQKEWRSEKIRRSGRKRKNRCILKLDINLKNKYCKIYKTL
jgi:hypothetical protein